MIVTRLAPLVAGLLLTACAAPATDDLRSRQATTSFVLDAPMECVYTKAVEHASSYLGLTEPKFTWHLDLSGRSAWFRQPLTLVELLAVSDGKTEVRRFQTATAAAVGQGDELVAFIRTNPCRRV